MNTPLQNMRNGIIALVGVFVVATAGFHFIGNYNWLDAIWMVVITISTTGYSERSTLDAPTKIFVIAVIVVGVTASAYTFTGIIQMILQGEIDNALGQRRMDKRVSQLTGHTIICGFGKTGPRLAEQFARQNQPYVILDTDHERYENAVAAGHLTLCADATDEEILKRAGILDAKAIVVALPTDAENVFITLSARNLCPNIRIVAEAQKESSSVKLRQAGANEVVMGHQMVASHMARLVTRPSTAKFFALLNQAEHLDLELDEFVVLEGSNLIGQSIAQLGIRDSHDLLVVAIKPHGGEMDFNPPGSMKFNSGDTVLIMGKSDDIERFQSEHPTIDTMPAGASSQ